MNTSDVTNRYMYMPVHKLSQQWSEDRTNTGNVANYWNKTSPCVKEMIPFLKRVSPIRKCQQTADEVILLYICTQCNVQTIYAYMYIYKKHIHTCAKAYTYTVHVTINT